MQTVVYQFSSTLMNELLFLFGQDTRVEKTRTQTLPCQCLSTLMLLLSWLDKDMRVEKTLAQTVSCSLSMDCFAAEEMYDTPRDQEDRFDHYDDNLDNNGNRIGQEDLNMKKQLEEYKVFGRMTEKEVQLALLMKRVKERYITQEQALEMARVLRLEVGEFQ